MHSFRKYEAQAVWFALSGGVSAVKQSAHFPLRVANPHFIERSSASLFMRRRRAFFRRHHPDGAFAPIGSPIPPYGYNKKHYHE